MNVVQLFQASVVRNPKQDCLRFKEDGAYVAWSYDEVWKRILRLAQALRELGVKQGNKVALMAESSPDWVLCDFAIMALGAVVVPIYPTLPPNDVAYILKNANASHFIVDRWNRASSLNDLLPETVQGIILFDPEHAESSVPIYPYPDLLEVHRPLLDAGVIDALSSGSVATIVHTSGTSGKPKGVMLSHDNLTSNIEACLANLTVQRDDVTLSYLPLSHIFERTVGHFAVFTAGGTVAYAEGIDTIQENLREVRPTILVTVPRLLEKVYAGIQQRLEHAPSVVRRAVQAPAGEQNTLQKKLADVLVYKKVREGLGGRLRFVVSGGAGLARDIAAFYGQAGIAVCEGYGMTETAPVIAFNPLEDIRAGTVGRPLTNVEVKIADDGELLVKGPNVMLGYYGDPKATSETIDPDGWLHTGDIADIQDGYIRIVERKKHLLVLATGKNVAPFPIENAITLSPYIADCVLVGDNRKYVGCLVVPDWLALQVVAKQFGLPESDYKDWLQNLRMRTFIQRELQRAIQGFADFEQPKRAILLVEPFTMDSGELTPTLKVKANVVVRKYGAAIEAMYEGISYLDIFGSPQLGMVSAETTNEAVLAAETANEATPVPLITGADGSVATRIRRGNRKAWLTLGAALIVLGAGIGIAKSQTVWPKHLNLLSTIKNVHHTNDNINAQNDNIVTGMGTVRDLSSLTPQMATQLSSLSSGVGQQNGNLLKLDSLSEQEISLSKQFGSVAASMNGDLTGVSSSTSQQAHSVAAMASAASQLSSTAKQMEQTNQSIANKLNQATSETKQVSGEMP